MVEKINAMVEYRIYTYEIGKFSEAELLRNETNVKFYTLYKHPDISSFYESAGVDTTDEFARYIEDKSVILNGVNVVLLRENGLLGSVTEVWLVDSDSAEDLVKVISACLGA